MFYSVVEAATALACHPANIRRAIRAGRLQAIRLAPHGPYRVILPFALRDGGEVQP
jgi:hypothetical protein